MLYAEGTGARQKARCALGMHVGARLKGPVHSRDQGHLVLDPLEWFQGGGQFERMLALGQVGLGFVGLEIVSIEKGNNPIFFARKEGTPDHSDGNVVKGHTLSDSFRWTDRQAFQRRQGEDRAPHAA